MINKFLIGAYWCDRQLTLRQYADSTFRFFTLLRTTHPAFETLEWVGNRPNSAVKLNSDLANLDELIYQHAGSNTRLYPDANPDGTPSWKSVSDLGYGMRYSTGKSINEGSISISISAGSFGASTPDAVVVTFPTADHALFSHRDFFEYGFLKKLFLLCMDFWKAETGELTNYAFRDEVSPAELSYVGWLTYLRNPRAAALRNSASLKGLIFENASDGGTLISLGPAMISPDNDKQVDKARRLRGLLIDEKIIRGT